MSSATYQTTGVQFSQVILGHKISFDLLSLFLAHRLTPLMSINIPTVKWLRRLRGTNPASTYRSNTSLEAADLISSIGVLGWQKYSWLLQIIHGFLHFGGQFKRNWGHDEKERMLQKNNSFLLFILIREQLCLIVLVSTPILWMADLRILMIQHSRAEI